MRYLFPIVATTTTLSLVLFTACGSSNSGSGTGANTTSTHSSSTTQAASSTSGTPASSGSGSPASTVASSGSGSTATSGTGGNVGVGGGGIGGAGGSVPAVSCNPVTNSGCTGGSACDIVTDQGGDVIGFQCYDPPNTQGVCDTCDGTGQNGPFCAGGGTCEALDQAQTMFACARYCCTDADCGAGNVCDVADMIFMPVSTTLGVCLPAPVDGGTPTTDGGSGDGGTADAGLPGEGVLGCNTPTTAMSNGSCVTVGM